MEKLIESFVKYKFYANLIIVVLLISGILGLKNMTQAFFPETTSRFINIQVTYLGASPEEMEEGVTARIEEALRGIVGIKEITSTSAENFSSIQVETTGDIDIDEVLADVKNGVDGISSMPTGAERPVIYKVRNRSMIMILSLTGNTDMISLKEAANRIEEDLLNSGKVSQVQQTNPPSIELAIEVREADLQRYQLSFNDIAQAVQMNNQDLSGGQLKSDTEEMLIRLRSRSTDPQNIEDIIVRANPSGGFIRVRDIATVRKKLNDDYIVSLNNGKPSLTLNVNKLPEEDIQDITEYVEAYIEKFNASNPSMELGAVFKFYPMLLERIDMLLNNGIIGLLLVIIALALFLNWKLSLWVAWGIPSSFLAMFLVASMMGVTINMISLFGMILVIGILVDDGIVIGENIYVHFEKGKGPMRAAIDGTMEVMPAVVTSITTTLVAFSPLLFIEGRLEFLRDMAIIVILTLSFSLLEAFFVLPSHLGSKHVLTAKSLKPKGKYNPRVYLDKGINYLRDTIYSKVLIFVLKWRYAIVFIPLALIFITVGLVKGGYINFTIFPNLKFDNFNVDLAYTPGTGEAITKQQLKELEDKLWEVNSEMRKEYGDTADLIKNTILNVGSAFSGIEQGAHAGNIQVILTNLENYNLRVDDVITIARKKLGEVPEAKKYTIAAQGRFGKPVSISIMGRNEEELEASKETLKEYLAKDDRIKDIVDNNTLGKQEILLKLKPKAYFLGLNEVTIANYVRSGFYGYQAQRLQEGREEIRIWVKYPENERQTLGELENIKVRTANGEFLLKDLVDFDKKRSPVSIKRFNGRREIRVEADVIDPDEPLQPILSKLEEEVPALIKSRFSSVDVEFMGQQKDGAETAGQMQKLFPIAFALMILIIMIHFKSALQALIIVMMIPLSMLGVLWGHGLHDKVVSMLSVWGIVALTGVIINDAVVFLSRFNDLMKEKWKFNEALIEAGKSRLRPIILTTLTTSIGLYPLILEKSFQAQFLVPMAISLAYGVAVGTFFILLFFPVLIHLLNDARRAFWWLWTGIKPTAEEVEVAVKNSKIIVQK